jgi:predicted lipid-binding transport protein (Tim44 family)
MSKWILSLFVALLTVTFIVPEAEARRLGGGRTIGTQRNVTPAPSKAPAQQAAPGQQQAQPVAPGSKWGPLLGGLALGGILGYLFGGSGLLGVLLLAMLAFAAVFAIRALMQRRGQEAPRPMQFAGMGGQTMTPPPSTAGGGLVSAKSNVPADFDTASFLRGAKINFVKLQLANDRAALDELREFTTDEVFEALQADVTARAGRQETEIASLEAELLELATEGGRFWASVRFSGMEREAPGRTPAGFEEVWNLVKPADGSTGWLLAGIQQMH